MQFPIAYRDHLRRLKVKDLQDYLRARQIATNQCHEKRELIELILQHAEERASISHSTSNSQPQARQQTQANPSQTNSQRPAQPRSSNFSRPSNTQPVQVCTFHSEWPFSDLKGLCHPNIMHTLMRSTVGPTFIALYTSWTVQEVVFICLNCVHLQKVS